MALDPEYVDAIRKSEGYAPEASWDYKQYSSGYGTKAQPGDETFRKITRPRVQRASGIPCALFSRAKEFQHNSGATRGEIAVVCPVTPCRGRTECRILQCSKMRGISPC